MTALLDHPAALEFVSLALDRLSVPERRGYLDWAESEFVVPDGRYKGEVFHRDFQPASALFLEEMDRGGWRRFAVTGPRQGGKTMIGYVIPVLYTLFELGETTVLGVPDLKLASDKWQIDLLPAIEASRYRSRLPTRGPGSRGGKIEDTIDFGGGVYLKFMTGGGGDAARSGFTSRVAFITEVDKLDVTGGQSREADKVTQIFGVTGSYGHDEVHGMESTASFSRGRVWREFQAGTQSAIFCPCPHCRGWVCPGRDCLKGWREAESSGEAEERAGWHCPACGEQISEAQRAAMNRAGVLVHKGQKVEWRNDASGSRGNGGLGWNRRNEGETATSGDISNPVSVPHDCRSPDEGDRRIARGNGSANQNGHAQRATVCGPDPATRTLGFRFDAFNNLFWDAKYVAAREWAAANAPDEENSEKEIHQFVWAIPWDPPELDSTKLESRSIARRQRGTPRGQAPGETETIVVTADPGRRVLHWDAIAVMDDGRYAGIDYGVIEIPSDDMPMLRALLSALRELRDIVAKGFAVVGRPAPLLPSLGLVDLGGQVEGIAFDVAVHEFVRESRGWQATKGFSSTKYREIKDVPTGEKCHLSTSPTQRSQFVAFDSDHWKGIAHQALTLPLDAAGSFGLFTADPKEHTSFAKHCVAEELEQKYSGGQAVLNWVNPAHRPNHHWDCLTLGMLGAHIVHQHRPKRQQPDPPPARDPDARRRPMMNRGPIRRRY